MNKVQFFGKILEISDIEFSYYNQVQAVIYGKIKVNEFIPFDFYITGNLVKFASQYLKVDKYALLCGEVISEEKRGIRNSFLRFHINEIYIL